MSKSYPTMGMNYPYSHPMYTQAAGNGMHTMPSIASPYMMGMWGASMSNNMPSMMGMMPPTASGTVMPGVPVQGQAFEESYIENILRLNLGKMATVYMTFENNPQWNAKVFKGNLEAAGRDHIIVSDPSTGMRYLLLMVNLDYITFEEELQYDYPTSPFPTPRKTSMNKII